MRLKFLGLFLVALIWQTYCSIYTGLLSGLAVFVYALVLLNIWAGWREIWTFLRSQALKIFAYLFVALCVLLPLILPYYQRMLEGGYRDYKDVHKLLPNLGAFIAPADATALWTFLLPAKYDMPIYWEKELFLGLVPIATIILAILVVRAKKFSSESLKILLWSVLLYTLIFLPIGENSLFQLIRHIPGFGAIKAVGRFMLPLSFLVALIMIEVLKFGHRVWPRHSSLFVGLFTLLLLCDQATRTSGLLRFEKIRAQERVKKIVEQVDGKQLEEYDGLAYLTDSDDRPEFLQLDAALAGQTLNWPSVNGYSSTSPPGFSEFWTRPDSASLNVWLQKSCERDENTCQLRIYCVSD